MWAVEKGFVNLVQTLLSKQDKKQRDTLGNSALHYAVLAKNETVDGAIIEIRL